MRVDRCGLRGILALVSVLAVAVPVSDADAQPNRHRVSRAAPSVGVQCVPFARHLSGVDIVGNARTWWEQAEGRYHRGARPEVGSVLAFKPTGAMRLGHVSVVSKLVSAREVLVDHANWPGPGMPKGRVARNVSVIDVSDSNDWSAVRVEIHGRGSGYGRIYPTWGFIYPRAVAGTVVAARAGTAPAVARLNARAAAAAARPPAYVGQPGAGLDEEGLVELADATEEPVVRGSRPIPAPAAPRQAVRESGDDLLVWGAPNRSLR